MDIIEISSDSSCPPSPSTHSPNRINDDDNGDAHNSNEQTSRCSVKPIGKRPVHNFSSSDESDSDSDSSPNPKSTKFSTGPATKKVTLDNCNVESDNELCIIEDICTQEGYVHHNVKGACSDQFLDVDVLQKNRNSDIKSYEKQSKGSKKKLTEEERQKRLKEKEEKLLEKAREKALKKAASEAQKANRPGECMKHIQVLIDQRILTEEYSGNLLTVLQASQIKYSIQEQLNEKTISWIKTVNNYHCDDNGEIIVSSNMKEENIVMIIMSSQELIELVKTMRLRSHIQNVSENYLEKRVILVIYKLEEYYRLLSVEKKRKFKAMVRTGSKNNQKTTNHEICHSDIERALIEIQLFENTSHRTVETPQDLGSLVAQFTKALAERDFKLEKQQREQEKLGWFASGDSRDTVKVDKNGNGLFRLWKQQLCQFTAANLDIAEAIVSLYPSPKSLIQAYEKCSTQKEGQQLLQDIAVRRSAGPLTSVRRIGPELSKKIYNFFTSLNGDALLS